MKKKKIMIDIDDVICDSNFLILLNDFLGSNYTIDDFHDYHIENIIPTAEKKIEFYNFITTQQIYGKTKLKDNCVETIKKLNENYDVYICSAFVIDNAVEQCGFACEQKYNFLRKYFSFLNPHKIIFTSSKEIINADIKIDDKPSNLENAKTKLLFTAYHNKNLNNKELAELGITRVNNWDEIAKILL